MKLLVLAIAILSSSFSSVSFLVESDSIEICLISIPPQAEIQEPEKKMISPDFLWEPLWRYQSELHEFQNEIDSAIYEAITAVSIVLEHSTTETLGQYESHVDRVEELFSPALEVFQELSPGTCRNTAERILNETTFFTGFSASNCANQYNKRVTEEINRANIALNGFDDIYSQVQSIAVKAFVKQNLFLTPEDILERLEHVYDHLRSQWEASRPEISTLRHNLKAAINTQNVELGNCHNLIEEDASGEYQRFSRMVQTCYDFENSRTADSFAASSAFIASYTQQLEEFLAEHSKLKLYEWAA